MATLSRTLRQLAHTGDLHALVDLLELCTEGLQFTTSFSAVLDIVFHHLRPEVHPKIPLDLIASEAHHTWLQTTLVSLVILFHGVRTTADIAVDRQLPKSMVSTIASHWKTHIFPCLIIIVDNYILDDLQPTLPPIYKGKPMCKNAAYTIVTSVVDTMTADYYVGMLGTVQADEEIGKRMARLFIQYLGWNVLPTAYHRLWSGKLPRYLFTELYRHPNLSSSIYEYLANLGKKNFTKTKMVRMEDILSLFSKLFTNEHSLLLLPLEKYPEIGDRIISLWNRCITQKNYTVEPTDTHRSRRGTPISDRDRKHTISALSAIISCIILHGSLMQIERLIRHRLLQCIAITCAHWPQVENHQSHGHDHFFVDDLKNTLLPGIQRQLHHYSIATVTARALRDDQCKPPPQGTAWRTLNLLTPWNTFRQYVAKREQVLSEYKECLLERPLCCNLKCTNTEYKKPVTRKCGACKYTLYCSPTCQKIMWSAHKITCSSYTNTEFKNARDRDFFHFQANADLVALQDDILDIGLEAIKLDYTSSPYPQISPTPSLDQTPELITVSAIYTPRDQQSVEVMNLEIDLESLKRRKERERGKRWTSIQVQQ